MRGMKKMSYNGSALYVAEANRKNHLKVPLKGFLAYPKSPEGFANGILNDRFFHPVHSIGLTPLCASLTTFEKP
jgi:hypothetical protein